MTAIEWTDETWNPVTGCTKVSPGCANCYIEKTPPFRMKGIRFERGRIPVTLHYDRLDQPLHWRKPRRVFVCSMADLFHEDVPDNFIDRVFATMAICGATRMTCKWAQCDHGEDAELERSGCWMQGEGRENPIHTFQVLTKRPERMKAYLSDPDRQAKIEAVGNDPEWSIQWGEPADMIEGVGWPLPNVWLGVSAENQFMLDQRIPILLDTPAAKRFVSCEPLLGPLNLWRSLDIYEHRGEPCCTDRPGWHATHRHTDFSIDADNHPLHSMELPGVDPREPHSHRPRLDWVIAGGESGGSPERALVERNTDAAGVDANQAPAHLPVLWEPKPEALEWVRSLRDQCQAAAVPLFVKQWGGPTPKAGGRSLDGRTWDEFPQREAVPA